MVYNCFKMIVKLLDSDWPANILASFKPKKLDCHSRWCLCYYGGAPAGQARDQYIPIVAKGNEVNNIHTCMAL